MITELDTLGKLQGIQERATVFAILWRNAGVGFQFYEGPEEHSDSWRDFLVVHHYYPTFEEAVEAEYERLQKVAP